MKCLGCKKEITPEEEFYKETCSQKCFLKFIRKIRSPKLVEFVREFYNNRDRLVALFRDEYGQEYEMEYWQLDGPVISRIKTVKNFLMVKRVGKMFSVWRVIEKP